MVVKPSNTSSEINNSAVLIWIIMQLMAIAMGCATPIWARQSAPFESASLSVMVVGQIFISSLIFPYLLSNKSTSLVVIALAIPFVQLAGAIAESTKITVMLATLHITMWLVGLSVLTYAIRARGFTNVVIAVVCGFSCGTAIVAYLMLETVAKIGAGNHLEAYGPLIGGAILAIGKPIGAVGWGEVAIPLFWGGLLKLGSFRHRGIRLATSPHNPPKLDF